MRTLLALAALVAVVTSLPQRTEACDTTPYVGDVCAVAYGACPQGFAAAQGQLLPIGPNQPLFSLLGTTFGGDGVNTFALPDLRGRTIVGVGGGPNLPPVALGQIAGNANTTRVAPSAGSRVQVPAGQLPSLGLTYCIALTGIFPSQN
jgi:microcystin-dependent protein